VCRTFCRLRGLIPGKHVVFSLRNSREYDEAVGAKIQTTKIVFMTTIDAARLVALRSGEYTGQDPEVYIYLDDNGAPTIESNIPLPQLPLVPGQTALPREPWAVRTTVYRKSFDHPITSVARFDAYAATYKQGDTIRLTEIWSRRSPEMLAKCSEMLSLRKAFPEELASLYLDIELKNEVEDEKPRAVTPASVVPLPPPVPTVDHTPAQGKAEPRPGEPKVEFHASQVPATLPEHSGETLVVKAAPVDPKLAAALAAAPSLKPASALPPPKEKKKGGRPKKSPDNGPPVEGITDADIASSGTPAPVVDEAANLAEAQEFVASVSNFTPTEAAAQGLPEPPDYSKIPEGKQKDEFIARVRDLVKTTGVDNAALGEYIKKMSGKTSSKYLTVGDWNKAFEVLDKAKADGTIKQLLKETK